MSDVTEGLGSAIEGGLLARAVDPDTGTAQSRNTANCLNCGASLQGAFCHECGQKAHIHRTISGIMHDLVHGVLHLDGKLWNTLPLLVFKPGRLTREYIEGKRARHVSPMAMFLFSVFLMFAVFQALGITTPGELDPQITDATGAEARSALETQRTQLQRKLATLPETDPAQAAAKEELADIETMLKGVDLGTALRSGEPLEIDATITGIKAIDDGILAKWRKNPTLMLYKLQSNSYKFSWLLIPLSIPFMWLLFLWRRQYKAYDHAVFVTYSLAFMSLLFIVLSIIGTSGTIGFWAFAALVLVPPIHLYKQLRGAYGLSRFSAFWRLMALSLFIWVVLILFLQALLLLGGV